MPATQHAPPPHTFPRDIHDKGSLLSLQQSGPAFDPAPVSSPRSPVLNDSRQSDLKPVQQLQQSPRVPSPPPRSPPAPSSSKNGDIAPRPPHTPAKEIPEKPIPKEDEEPPSESNPIDMETFQQLLELDDEIEDADGEDEEFSKGMVHDYFKQAKETFQQLHDALDNTDLPELSSLGHFLKGSSASLGVTRVQAACTRIQHYGLLRDEENDADLTSEKALDLITKELAKAEAEYAVAEKWFKKYYGEDS